MPKEALHAQDACRCGGSLSVASTMSWFNDDTICPDCSLAEMRLKTELRDRGLDIRDFMGCGYLPTPDGKRPGVQ